MGTFALGALNYAVAVGVFWLLDVYLALPFWLAVGGAVGSLIALFFAHDLLPLPSWWHVSDTVDAYFAPLLFFILTLVAMPAYDSYRARALRDEVANWAFLCNYSPPSAIDLDDRPCFDGVDTIGW